MKSGRAAGGGAGAAARPGPPGATRARLGDVVLLEAGSRPRGGASKDGGGVPSIGGEHLTAGGRFDFSRVKHVPERFYLSMRQGRIRERDVLLVKDGATIGKASLVTPAFPFARACVNEHVFILRPKDPGRLRPEYLFYFLRTTGAQARIRQRISGSAQGGLTKRALMGLPIDIPPPGKQASIASILSNVDALIGDVETLSARYTTLQYGLSQEIFGSSVKDLKWKSIALSSLTRGKSQYGIDAPAVPYDNTLARYIRIADIRSDGTLDEALKASVKLQGNEKYLLKHNDLLFARAGTVGRTMLVKNGLSNAIFVNTLIRFNVDSLKVDPLFLEQYTRSAAYKAWIISVTAQSVVPNINARQFARLPVPLPPRQKQRQIASILSGVDAVIENHRLYQQQLERLKRGLMQKLLSGKIRV